MNEDEEYGFRQISEAPQYYDQYGNPQIMNTYSGQEGEYLTFDRNRNRAGYNERFDDPPAYTDEDLMINDAFTLTSGVFDQRSYPRPGNAAYPSSYQQPQQFDFSGPNHRYP